MIVSYGMVEDVGAGFRELLFLRRWRPIKHALLNIAPQVFPINAMITIGFLSREQRTIGVDGNAFVVQHDIPIAEFQDLLIEQRNDLVLDILYRTILIAFEHYQLTLPPDVERIFGKTSL